MCIYYPNKFAVILVVLTGKRLGKKYTLDALISAVVKSYENERFILRFVIFLFFFCPLRPARCIILCCQCDRKTDYFIFTTLIKQIGYGTKVCTTLAR